MVDVYKMTCLPRAKGKNQSIMTISAESANGNDTIYELRTTHGSDSNLVYYKSTTGMKWLSSHPK